MSLAAVWRVALLALLLPATVFAERLAIRTFNSSDGLGSSFVNHILQDSRGYVWFATRDGLCRWNGYEFARLSDAGLPGPAVDRVYQVRSGEYFVIANDGSLHSWQPRIVRAGGLPGPTAFRRRRVLVDGRDMALTCLYEDARGRLWGGGHGVLVKGVGTTDTPIRLPPGDAPGGPLVIVRDLLEDRVGTLWVGTNRGLFRLLPNGELRRHALSPSGSVDVVSSLALDASGRVWIGHRGRGVIVLEGEGPERGTAFVLDAANGLPTNGVTCVLPTASGHVWVGTDKGLARVDGDVVTAYTKEHGLCDNLIYSLCEGGDGSLWVSTPTGAMRVDLDGFTRYTTTEGLATDHVVAFRETPDGGLHAVGVDWSINTLNGRRFRARRLPMPAGSTSMWASQAIYLDRRGRWWALARQGLYRFDRIALDRSQVPAPDRVYTAADGLPSSSAFRVFQDRSGALWVGTRSDDPADFGLARFGPDLARATAFGEAEGLPPWAAPSAFAEDRAGTLWIGFYQGGLARVRDGRLQVFGPDAGLPTGAVTALFTDSTGRLWVATNLAGLARIDRPSADRLQVRVYSTRDGLASNNVRALAEDRFGRIYAGSARGVDRLAPDSGRLRHFGGHDGLVSDFITAAFRDARGDLWFGTFSGAFRLSPRPDPGEEPPPIAVTGLRISGAPYPVSELGQTTIEGVSVGPDRRDIEVDYVSVARRQPDDVSYQYSIDSGSEATWSPPTKRRTVGLARLEPGRYVFAVRAITSGGVASPVPSTVVFTVRPPFYRRWWFMSLALAAAAAVLLAAVRYRVGRLLEMQRLRLSIASDLHDEVAANLSSIAMFSELLRGQTVTPSPLLDRIAALARQSVEAIREIIWSIDPKPETVGSLLVRLRDAMVVSCRARGLRLTVSVPPVGLDHNLTPDERKNIWLMLKEAVTNASRHSGGTEIRVTLWAAGRGVRIAVQDDGSGHTPPSWTEGRGMGTMKARAEAVGGSMSVRAQPEGGTTVEFVLPLST